MSWAVRQSPAASRSIAAISSRCAISTNIATSYDSRGDSAAGDGADDEERLGAAFDSGWHRFVGGIVGEIFLTREEAQVALGHEVLGVALDGNDVDRVRLVRVHVDDEAEVGRQVAADLLPIVARVVAAQDVPVLLHEQDARPLGAHGDVVNAVADFGVGIRNVLRTQAAVDRFPGLARVVAAERAGGRDGDVDAVVPRIENDRVQAHTARAGLPLGTGSVAAQPGKLVPAGAAVLGLEQRRILGAGVDGVGIRVRRLEVPHPFELPRPLRAVVLLLRRQRLAGLGRGVVDELVALPFRRPVGRFLEGASRRLPGLAAVVRALDDLPEPAARLRAVDPVRIGWRSFEVIDFPARETRSRHFPLVALAIRVQDERAFARADEDPYLAHRLAPWCRTFMASFVPPRRTGRAPRRCRWRAPGRGHSRCDSLT